MPAAVCSYSVPAHNKTHFNADPPNLRRHFRRQPVHFARAMGRHRRAGVTGQGLGAPRPKFVADACGDVVTEPVGRPAWDVERLTGVLECMSVAVKE